MMKTSKRKIVTVEKRKNVRWKVILDLNISYANVQLHENFTYVQQNVTLTNDIAIRKSHLGIKNTEMKHFYQNTSAK